MLVKNSAQCLIHGEQLVHNSHREGDARDDCHQAPGRTQNLIKWHQSYP